MNENEIKRTALIISKMSNEIARIICMGEKVEVLKNKNGIKINELRKKIMNKAEINKILSITNHRVEIYQTEKGYKILDVTRKEIADNSTK